MEAAIYTGLKSIKMFDVHTHMDASHLSARGLHDILLYHMVISELYSAGCPDGNRLSEAPPEDEIADRIRRAIPYLGYIQNTSCFWGVKLILKELYEWDEPITLKNWEKLHQIIAAKAQNREWPREILKKAGIAGVCTELWRGRKGEADDVFQYSLEWAFFTRTQWGQYDTALMELENAWGQDTPGAPLPVTLKESRVRAGRQISSLDHIRDAIEHYCSRIPYDRILSMASHLSTDIEYGCCSDEEMERALKRREAAGREESRIYANYIFDRFLDEFEKRGKGAVLQFSLGAEPLPMETGSKLRTETVFELARIFESYPGIKFQILLASAHNNQSLCTLARELPNLSLAGYWWHNFFPSTIRQIMGERLDMLAANRQIGFFSDAYCADWAFAKAVMVRKQLACVFAAKVAQGQYTADQCMDIAQQIFFEAPQLLLNMIPARSPGYGQVKK